MILKLKSLTEKEKIIDIDGSSTIKELKERIYEMEDIHPDQQRIICNGKVLNQLDKTILQYKISSQSRIHLILALRGG
ncbi:NEDD8 [Hepatospora eriocheir]|uniref:NEDD8 n=1 Tax=Hepatospora eriocheir TaxID=1081669 RepID=A0A1X0Q9R4_9MICR|nr:NEDD8 [Hepatospora eriocheir]ORE00351.1 NEDD8 [Hepatospora eriocheir]